MQCDWPTFDEGRMQEQEKTIAVQVNGKLRATVVAALDAADEDVVALACANEKIARMMEGMEIVKMIIVKNKLVNLILKPAKK